MEKTRGLWLWLLIVSAAAVGAGQTERPDKSVMVMFQDALYQEQTAGDLDKAIELYQQVIQDAAEVEKLAARATFQLGMCYLKKDDKAKAVEYFTKVVKQYPTQKELAEKASKQLDKIQPKTKDSVFATVDGQVLMFIAEQFGKIAVEANQKHLAVNSHIYYVDPNGFLYAGGMNVLYNWTGRTITQKTKLTGMSGSDNTFYGTDGQVLNTETVPDEQRQNFYHVYWIPKEPLAPEESLYYGWSKDGKQKMTKMSDGAYSLRMQNQYGSPVIETFFLVLPKNIKVSQSNPPTGNEKLLSFDVYWWSKQVAQGENHVETMSIEKAESNEQMAEAYKQKLEQAVTVNISQSPDNNELSVQYAVMAIAEAAGVPYQWDKSAKLADPQLRNYIDPVHIDRRIASQALTDLLKPVGLLCRVDVEGLYLYDPKRFPQIEFSEQAAGNSSKQVIWKDSFEQGNENPDGWEKGNDVEGVAYLWDKDTASDGKASLCLKKTAQKYFPVAQWTRNIEYSGNAKKIELSAKVRALKTYKAVMDVLFLDEKGEWIKHEWASYIGAKEENDPPANHNWKEYSGIVEIPEKTKTIVIGLQMYGPGTVWMDELEVSYLNEIATSSKPDKLCAEDLTAEGWKLWQERKLAEAEKKFEEAAAADPTNDGAYQGLGWAQLNQGKKNNAKASFEKCVELNPQNSAALNGLGWIAHGNNDKDGAIQWWEKAVAAQPGATAALSGLTKTYMEIEQYDKAVHYYKMWLKVEPDNQEAKEGLEKAKKGKPLTSTEDIARLIKELDDSTAPRFVAMNRLIELGKPAVAPLLEAMKTSNNWQIPKALGAIGDKTAIGPMIEKWEKNNTSPMKEVLAESLGLITGQTFGEDLQKWQQWWKGAKGTYTPEATISAFTQAALQFDIHGAMIYVAQDSHDYDDIKEIFKNPSHPFYILFKKANSAIPVEVTKVDISDTMCEATWKITLKEDFSIEGIDLKAGEKFELDGNLHKYGDKWLITGI